MIAGVEVACPPHWTEEEAGYGIHWETAKKIAYESNCDIDFVEFPLSYIVSGEQEIALEVRKKIEEYLEQAVKAEGGNVQYLSRQLVGFFKELLRRILFLLSLLLTPISKVFGLEKKTKNEYITIPDDDYNEFTSNSDNKEKDKECIEKEKIGKEEDIKKSKEEKKND
ncbi:hypothetical protein BCR36DRAFT_358792 [Piromyces finnis]|uniref:Uncharacterized protein n=1 Tax=Piromyces finnis TaxID=1754191 RepID=A0A1Y1V1D0_9FUNG|nr:hypothetical protein BCR36DRAFT_358792 [Piromyces finnis]|eukprot:ORX44983.1 hypothetical protein BCR36DRAFT_358792 [Piromyces finnis]